MDEILEEDVLIYICHDIPLYKILIEKAGNPFKKRICQVVFSKIEEFMSKEPKLPLHSTLLNMVKEFIAGSTVEIFKIEEFTDFIDRIYKKEVDAKYTRNVIIEHIKQKLIRNMFENFKLSDTSLTSIKEKIREIDSIDVSDFKEREDYMYVADVCGREKMYLDDANHTRIPTPWKELNGLIRGGNSLGDEVVLVGFTGMGKSTILACVAGFALANHYGVKIFSTENTVVHICEMLDAYYTGYTRNEIRESFSNIMLDALTTKFNQYEMNSKACSITTFLPHSTTLDVIEDQLIRDLEEVPNLRLVIIDWGDCIKPAQKYNEKRHEFASVFHGIKALARKYNVVIWTATMSTSDSLHKYMVSLKDISESRAKCYMAQLILTMCQVDEEKKHNPALFRFNVAKNTWGKSEEIIPMVIDYTRTSVIVNDKWKGSELEKQIMEDYGPKKKGQKGKKKQETIMKLNELAFDQMQKKIESPDFFKFNKKPDWFKPKYDGSPNS